MNQNGLSIKERIKEISTMCDREQPIYEQISSFSIALYVFGFFPCQDLLSADEVDFVEAGSILKEHFIEIQKEKIPSDYQITKSADKFLLVIGDPVFPSHFAVVADKKSPQPYFSKLPFFGSGFDSLKELEREFVGIDGITRNDIAYYKMIPESVSQLQPPSGGIAVRSAETCSHSIIPGIHSSENGPYSEKVLANSE